MRRSDRGWRRRRSQCRACPGQNSTPRGRSGCRQPAQCARCAHAQLPVARRLWSGSRPPQRASISSSTAGARCSRAGIATGLTDQMPEVPGVRERWGRDVLHCPYCHGYEVRDQPLGVLGSGRRSVHQAPLVRQLSPDVVVFGHTLAEFSAEDTARLAAREVPVVDGTVNDCGPAGR